jgi:predicted permease
VRETHGVQTAGISVLTPLSGRDRGAPVQVRGYEPSKWEDGSIRVNQVSEGYFETLGIPLLRGRLLTARDAAGAPQVVVINESAAKKYFGARDPLGEVIEFPRNKTAVRYQVIGIVQDTKHNSLREPARPFAFIPIRQPLENDRRVTLSVTSTGTFTEMALLQPIRSKVAALDPAVLISEVITIQSQLDSTLLTERLLSGLSTAFGALAVILASIGLYSVLSYRVGQQRQSIGVRMSLGASPSAVALDVLRQSGLVIAAGLACGLPLAFIAARAANSILWGVSYSDPMIYFFGIALLTAVGFLSAWLPARRASAIEPAEALRHS